MFDSTWLSAVFVFSFYQICPLFYVAITNINTYRETTITARKEVPSLLIMQNHVCMFCDGTFLTCVMSAVWHFRSHMLASTIPYLWQSSGYSWLGYRANLLHSVALSNLGFPKSKSQLISRTVCWELDNRPCSAIPFLNQNEHWWLQVRLIISIRYFYNRASNLFCA